MNDELAISIPQRLKAWEAYLDYLLSQYGIPPITQYVVIGLAVLLAIQVIRMVWKWCRPSRPDLPKMAGTKRSLKKDAKRAEKRGEFRQAGELYRSLGYDDKAIEMYKRSGAHRETASLYEQKKKWGEAAQAYEAAGNFEKAASMAQKQGNYLKAGELLAKGRRFLSAAEMYERGDSLKTAADLYKKVGYPQKAALCYEKLNDTLKAAELYEECYFQEKAKWRDAVHGTEQIDRGKANGYAHQAGRLYEKAGEYQKAAEILTSAGFDAEAADALTQAGNYEKAAEIYYEKKLFSKAAEACEKGGDSQKSYQIQGEMHLENGNRLEAAVCFEKAGNRHQAGEVYEQLGNTKKAGEMYLEGQDYHRAAEVFLAAGEIPMAALSLERGKHLKEAAELYEKLQEPEKAVDLYKEAGEHYGAAMLLDRLGRKEDCIGVLQKVEISSPDYHQASILLSKIFVEQGMLDAAKQRYGKIFVGEHPSPEALEHFYRLGMAFEKQKEYDEALAIYDRILAEDFGFADVKSRAEALRRALAEVKKALKDGKGAAGKAPAMSDGQGRYKILKKIGQGGMGVVYQAEDTVLHRIVAYKVLPPAVRENPRILENFLQEARVAASLSHTNIVTVFDTGKNDVDLYITMEYVDGVTLKEHMESRSPLPLDELFRISQQVCQGLDYAHNRNVIHRDIKPANIMISADEIVKIMDFGLAKIVNESMADKTTVKGTPMYMAPEQIMGKGVDQQSDIYSFGCTLFRMATGRAPFTEGDLYYHHLHTPPPAPRELNPELPEALERVILKCIEKEKATRYQKVKDLLKDLEASLSPT